jgi:hypothetical protein
MDPHTLPTPTSSFEASPVATPVTNPEFSAPEAPKSDENHNLELPTVMAAGPAPGVAPASIANPTAPLPAMPVDPMLAAAAPGVSPPPASDALDADDGDVIEKAWVLKAKSIVEQTRDDPYRQNKEINRIKADYIKKRYNKDVKLSEE